MSNAATEINRIIFIDRLLSNGKKYTPDEIAELLELSESNGGTSVKTVYRILKEMKEDFHAPIAVDDKHRRYYTCDKTLMLPSYITRADNLNFINIVRNILETIKDSPVYPKAEKIFNELFCIVPSVCNKTSATSRVIFLGAPAADVPDAIWNTIYNAMEKNYHIVIEYRLTGHNKTIKRGIRPYQLIFDDGIWDLWGYDCINRQKQQYNLCRIKSVEIKPELFELPDDFDYRNETPGTFGCYRDTKKKGMTCYKIHFEKGSYVEAYAKDRIWGNNSSVTEDETGTTISFENNQFLPILRWVLGWGTAVRPLEPEELVIEWKNEIKKMYKSIEE